MKDGPGGGAPGGGGEEDRFLGPAVRVGGPGRGGHVDEVRTGGGDAGDRVAAVRTGGRLKGGARDFHGGADNRVRDGRGAGSGDGPDLAGDACCCRGPGRGGDGGGN